MTNKTQTDVIYPKGYIDGFQMAMVADRFLTIGPGACRDSQNFTNIISDEELTISIDRTGINGIDSGSLIADTPYYIYVINDSTGRLPVAAILADISRSPYVPAGYDSYRRIGTWLTNATINLMQMKHRGLGNTRSFIIGFPVPTISNGFDTSLTTIQVYPRLPFGTRTVMKADFEPATSGNFFSVTSFGQTDTTNFSATGTDVTSLHIVVATEISPSGFHAMNYLVSNASDRLSLSTTEFEDYV